MRSYAGRTVNNATAGHMRCTDGALTCVTGTLLLEGLTACTGNLAAVLGLVGALACSSELCNDNLVQQGTDACASKISAGRSTLRVLTAMMY